MERVTAMFVVPTLVGHWLEKHPTEVGTTYFSHTLYGLLCMKANHLVRRGGIQNEFEQNELVLRRFAKQKTRVFKRPH
jgi:hypothetical protein